MGKRGKNRESPTGKGAKKRTLRRMDSGNKASNLNSGREGNRRIKDAVVANHFEVFIRDTRTKRLLFETRIDRRIDKTLKKIKIPEKSIMYHNKKFREAPSVAEDVSRDFDVWNLRKTK